MKKHREDLAKLPISKKEQHTFPLPMNFCKVSFTLAHFDNFDHNDKNTMFGTSSTHDTVSVLFQEVPSIKVSKPTKIEISLENVNMKVKLQCQEVVPFSTSKLINLPETFTVTSDQLLLGAEDRERCEKQRLLLIVKNLIFQNLAVTFQHGQDVNPFFQKNKFPQCKLD